MFSLALAGLLGCAQAAEPRYLGLEAYGHESGLSQLSVTSLVEDELGFLWIGTQDGLNRFDGHHFEVQRFRPDQPERLLSSSIDLLALDERERLWIGSNDAGLEVVDLRTRARVRYGVATLGHSQMLGIAPTLGGPIFVALPNALLAIPADLGAAQSISPIEHLVALKTDRLGRAIALSATCRLHLIELTAATLLWDGSSEGRTCMAFASAREGYWVADLAGGLFEIDLHGQQRAQVSVANELSTRAHVSTLEAGHDNALWVGLSDGRLLAVRPASAESAVQAIELSPAPNSAITLLHEDPAGVLWLGTYTDGLFRARSQAPAVRRELAPDPQRAGLKPSVRSFAQRGETRLIGFDLGLLKIDAKAEPRAVTAVNGMSVRAIAEGDDAGWWLGTQQGLHWLAADDSTQLIEGTESWRITALRREPDRLWVATRAGLKQFALPTMQALPVPEALRDVFLTSLERDARGRLWIGSNDSGVFVLDTEESVQQLSTAAGLVNSSVWALRADAAGMWVGSFSGGLHHLDFDGRLSTTFGERDGLSSSVIYGILLDARGRLWLSTNDGINLVDPASRRIQVLRPGDGLSNVEFNAGAAYLDPDMRLWFGGTAGVDVIEPWQREAKVPMARPVIAGLRLLGANGSDRSLLATAGIDIGRAERLELKYGDTALVLQLSAIEPTAPASARLRYRLHGIDTDWIDLPRAQLELTYAHLPPGSYRLEVKAAGRGAEFGASRSL
ncbi:two-component regulator propeller domain-containing protein [Aquimonas sp.]|jgi:ligand-binding sensor domain-containing protein|uniref:ligand-binding sensor domain-containing protein n=1 Tax=Aquimonas sp. TaxID=1872588 RepID=UPI0037BE6CA4